MRTESTRNILCFLQEHFVGKLGDPVYLLVWRDTSSDAHIIQEKPPFNGTHAEKQEFLARWEGLVNAEIAHLHPNVSFLGVSANFPCINCNFFKRATSTRLCEEGTVEPRGIRQVSVIPMSEEYF